jgi:hypothetical protein
VVGKVVVVAETVGERERERGRYREDVGRETEQSNQRVKGKSTTCLYIS